MDPTNDKLNDEAFQNAAMTFSKAFDEATTVRLSYVDDVTISYGNA